MTAPLDTLLLDDIRFAAQRSLDRGLAPATVAATLAESFVAFAAAAGDDMTADAALVTAFIETAADAVARNADAIVVGDPEDVPGITRDAPERFHGGIAWRQLGREQRRRIGGLALDLVVAWLGIDRVGALTPAARGYERAETAAIGALVDEAAAALRLDGREPVPVPAIAGTVLRLVVNQEESA